MITNINKSLTLYPFVNPLQFLDFHRKEIPINLAFIDSFTFKIELDRVQVIDEKLTSATCIYYESLDEMDSELHPPKPIIFSKNGITLRYSLCEIPIYDSKTGKKVPTRFVVITVTAKLLKEKYFEGINSGNIFYIYSILMQFDIIHCEFSTFLSGQVSDIDIAINRYIPLGFFQGLLKSFIQQCDKKVKHLREFDNTKNDGYGLTFNKRDWAKPSLPFIKLYFKETELQQKSKTFFDTYLSEHSFAVKNLSRCEATIKNYAHKKRLEKYNVLPPFRTLEDLLNIPQDKLLNFICFSLDSYISAKFRLKSPKLSPTDFLLFELMHKIEHLEINDILAIADLFEGTSPETTKVAKSRIRSKIEQLFEVRNELEQREINLQLQNDHITEYIKFLKYEVKKVLPKSTNALKPLTTMK